MAAYKAAEKQFIAERGSGGTVADAITLYLSSARYREMKPSSQKDYRRLLDKMREAFGHLIVKSITVKMVDDLRDKHAERPVEWNRLRSRMATVWDVYKKKYPIFVDVNPWEESARFDEPPSDQNRPWPEDVLRIVLTEATPAFRALLVVLLLTAQRISDVIAYTRDQYDPKARTLRFQQSKLSRVGGWMVLHVPDLLAEMLEAHPGVDNLLPSTPQGKPWKKVNAEETLRNMRERLGLPRYTLHGLRATGPTILKMLGVENRALRAITGHTSDRNLEIYLRGADNYRLAVETQDKLAETFGSLIREATAAGNQKKQSGATGRVSRRSKAESKLSLIRLRK
jgi:integrase